MSCKIIYKGITYDESEFKKQINRYIAINQLFEDDSNLANQVYEALGFNDNNFELKENKEAFGKEPHPEGATSYDIFSNGRKIGKIALFEGKNPMIKGLNLNESERNKGLGKALYKWLNYKAILKGGRLYADQEFISPDAQRVWESLNKEGLVDLTGNSPKFNNKQKQQALQLYSQYLDSIFPDSKVKDIVYHGSDKMFNKFLKEFARVDRPYFYFSFAEEANMYKEARKGSYIYPVILNVKNYAKGYTPDELEIDTVNNLIKQGYDAVAGRGWTTREEIAVFEPEQIHILSSKADIQGFKDYMAFQNSEFAKYGTYEQFREFITSKSSMEIENRLIEIGKIDRVC
jgi:hypothetical protein